MLIGSGHFPEFEPFQLFRWLDLQWLITTNGTRTMVITWYYIRRTTCTCWTTEIMWGRANLNGNILRRWVWLNILDLDTVTFEETPDVVPAGGKVCGIPLTAGMNGQENRSQPLPVLSSCGGGRAVAVYTRIYNINNYIWSFF